MSWLSSLFKRFSRVLSIFHAKEKQKTNVSKFPVCDKSEFIDLSQTEATYWGAVEFTSKTNQSHFTSAIIFKYLDGLLTLDQVYKSVYKLQKRGKFKKVTVLTSNTTKHVDFYALVSSTTQMNHE